MNWSAVFSWHFFRGTAAMQVKARDYFGLGSMKASRLKSYRRLEDVMLLSGKVHRAHVTIVSIALLRALPISLKCMLGLAGNLLADGPCSQAVSSASCIGPRRLRPCGWFHWKEEWLCLRQSGEPLPHDGKITLTVKAILTDPPQSSFHYSHLQRIEEKSWDPTYEDASGKDIWVFDGAEISKACMHMTCMFAQGSLRNGSFAAYNPFNREAELCDVPQLAGWLGLRRMLKSSISY